MRHTDMGAAHDRLVHAFSPVVAVHPAGLRHLRHGDVAGPYLRQAGGWSVHSVRPDFADPGRQCNAVQNGINGGDNSLTGAAIMAVTLFALNYVVAFWTSRSRRVEVLVEGVPVVLARDGKVFESVLRRELVSSADFEEALRTHGVEGVEDVHLALLETNGTISVMAK